MSIKKTCPGCQQETAKTGMTTKIVPKEDGGRYDIVYKCGTCRTEVGRVHNVTGRELRRRGIEQQRT
ncbi:hypothetical protein KJ903_00790 [Patescibacteria group bacterium]|nr:hypothetical protein [Patescibacteria group bacterium]